jgi:hypothetical protein
VNLNAAILCLAAFAAAGRALGHALTARANELTILLVICALNLDHTGTLLN